MAAFSIFPPINQPVTMHSARIRLPTLSVIEHPMLRIAERTKMKVTESASLHLRRSKTMPESPILRTASSVCWSDFGGSTIFILLLCVGTIVLSRKKCVYRVISNKSYSYQ